MIKDTWLAYLIRSYLGFKTLLRGGRFIFDNDGPRVTHHAVAFAVVPWNNLYFKYRMTVQGEVVGEPVAPLFGKDVKDMEVRARQKFGLLTHTLYWEPGPGGNQIDVLRAAMRPMAGHPKNILVERPAETNL